MLLKGRLNINNLPHIVVETRLIASLLLYGVREMPRRLMRRHDMSSLHENICLSMALNQPGNHRFGLMRCRTRLSGGSNHLFSYGLYAVPYFFQHF